MIQKIWKSLFLPATLATTLLVTPAAFGAQGSAKATPAKSATPAPAAAATTKAKDAKPAAVAAAAMPTEKEIADAKAKGLVWVNLNTKIYHKEGQFYGKTKNGQFMTEADAKKAGAEAAKTKASASADKASAPAAAAEKAPAAKGKKK